MSGFFRALVRSLTGKTSAPPSPSQPARASGAPASRPTAAPAAPVARRSAPRRAPDADALRAFVASVGDLPLFSGTAMQILQSVGNQDVSTEELGRLIAVDAGLAAGLLRSVNSSFYALPKKISTVHEAIAVLGLDQVRRTVLSAVSRKPVSAYLKDDRTARAFWRHLLLTAAMARHLALRNQLDGEVAYTAGLMHEVGRLAMLIQHPHLADLLLHVHHDEGELGIDRERAHFGFDHADAGGAMLELWGLPAAIVRAAYDHGDDELPADPLSAAVWRANLLAHDLMDDAAGEPATDDVELPWMVAVGLTAAQKRQMLDEIATFDQASS